MVVARIVSGGQTGVDRAALDVAMELGLEAGGWCPKGRRAEDGIIPARYPLQETDSKAYRTRTRFNVRDSDATLVLMRGVPRGGTAYTVECARKLRRPFLVVDVTGAADAEAVRAWLGETGARTLNVAGPRESGAPGIGTEAKALLRAVFGPRGSIQPSQPKRLLRRSRPSSP